MSQRPNIIFIVIDTARYDRFGCYGYDRPTSPNIDKIAAEATTYETCVSSATWTLPSHTSMFTGLAVSQHGVNGDNKKLTPQIPTLAQILQRSGYDTFGISPIHWISEATGLSRGFDHFVTLWDPFAKQNAIVRQSFNLLYKTVYFNKRDKGAQATNWLAKRWLGKWQEEAANEKPYFLFINYFDAHLPYEPPQPFRDQFETIKRSEPVDQDLFRYITGKTEMTDERRQRLSDLYDAGIAYVDHRIGQLVEQLTEMGLMENTLLVITGDHGENIGDHGHLGHRYIPYETLIHVPLVVKWPDGKRAGERVSQPVQTTDIFGTLIKAADVAPELVLQPLEPYTLMTDSPVREHAVAENMFPMLLRVLKKRFSWFEPGRLTQPRRALRTNQHNLIWAQDGISELYDMVADPEELVDISAENQPIVDSLTATLDSWVQTHTAAEGDITPELDEDITKQLEALGYL